MSTTIVDKYEKKLSGGEAELIATSTAKEVPCPVCSSQKYSFYCDAPSHYTPETYRITICDQCQMVFTNPQFTFYDKVAESRGATPTAFDEGMLRGLFFQATFTLSLIEPFTKGKRILDFGCGEGAFVAAALENGWQARGYDLNVGGMQEANRRWKTDVFDSGSFDAYHANFRESYDVVVALQVFEHLAEPLAVGTKAVQLLKPGGIFLIDVPNVNQVAERKSKGSSLDPTAHLCHFSLDTLSLLMDKLGCDIVYQSAAPSFFRIFRKAKLGKLAYPLGRLAKRVLPGIGTGVCVIGRKR